MSRTDPVQCPVCGWTGQPSVLDDADDSDACPACGEAIPDSG